MSVNSGIQSNYLLRADLTQNVAFTGSSARTANAIGSGFNAARLVATTACYYIVGDSGVNATTSHIYLPANVIEYVNLKAGQYVAAIQVSTGGTLNVTPATRG